MDKNLLKKLYYAVLRATFADKIRIRELKRRNRIAVLNLHRISPQNNPFWSPLHPEIFEELLRFLRDNFEVCLFEDLKSVKSDKPIAVISFDDGYYDFIEYALPLLRKYQMRANMNIIPQCVETGKAIWNVQLYDFLNSAPHSLISGLKLRGFDHRLEKDANTQSKLRFGFYMSVFLKQRPRRERTEFWQLIEPLIEEVNSAQTRMMNAEEIRQVSGASEIGVHSFSHESMGYEEIDFFLEDFAKCKNYFDSKLGLPLTIYAFPNGSYKPGQIEILRRENVEHILLVDEKFAKASSDVYPRLTVYGDTKMEIKLKSLGF